MTPVLERALIISAEAMAAIFVFMTLFWLSTIVLTKFLPAKDESQQ